MLFKRVSYAAVLALLICCVVCCRIRDCIELLPWPARFWVYSHFMSMVPERFRSAENSIQHFVKALAERDADALKEHVGFPFKREYPLPPIKTIEEFVAAIPQLFEEEDIKGMQDIDEWESVGWRGYMYKNGLVWLSEDFCLTAAGGWRGTEKEHELWLECVKKEIASLHPSLRDGILRPILSFITEDGAWRGRIDQMESKDNDKDVYRLAVYKAGTPIVDKPDAVVLCDLKVEGSACNEYYIGRDARYSLDVNNAGPEDSPEFTFNCPEIDKEDECASRAKSCEWK